MSESQRQLQQAWGIAAHNSDMSRIWSDRGAILNHPRAWLKCHDYDIPLVLEYQGAKCRIFPQGNKSPVVYQEIGNDCVEMLYQAHMSDPYSEVYMDNSRQFYLFLTTQFEDGQWVWYACIEPMPEVDPRSWDSTEL